MSRQTSKSTAQKRLRAFSREIPPDQAVHAVFMTLEPQHNAYADHAIAVIGASYVEKALQAAIITRLVPLPSEEVDRLASLYGPRHGPLCLSPVLRRSGTRNAAFIADLGGWVSRSESEVDRLPDENS